MKSSTFCDLPNSYVNKITTVTDVTNLRGKNNGALVCRTGASVFGGGKWGETNLIVRTAQEEEDKCGKG